MYCHKEDKRSVVEKIVFDFRCPLFLNIPSYCRLVVDPNDQCCKIPVCVTPAPEPTPGVRTPAPTATPGPGLTLAPNPNPQPSPTPQPKGNITIYKHLVITCK